MCVVVLLVVVVLVARSHAIPKDALTVMRMHVIKRKILHQVMTTGKMPRDLRMLPQLQGYDNRHNDGWGREIQYSVTEGQTVVLKSLGADGEAGGSGEDRDILGSFQARTKGGESNSENCPWTLEPRPK